MVPLRRSLRCLEQFAHIGAPLADWKREAGDGFGAIAPLLKETDRLARRWSRPGKPAMRIVEHDDGRAVAVCDEDISEAIELSHSDRVLRRPCERELRKRLCTALGLHASNEPIVRLPEPVAVGEWRPKPSLALGAWLAVGTTSDHLARVVLDVAARVTKPAILMTLTRSKWSERSAALAAQGGLALVPLEDVLDVKGNSWTRSSAWDAYTAAIPMVSSAIGSASAAAQPNASASSSPLVILGRPGDPCTVRGKPKPALTDGRHAVVAALIEAGDGGLGKDALEAIRPSARRMLEDLSEDSDWADVIVMAKNTNGRYRLRS